MNGQCIQIKELQDVASKTVVSFFKLSTETAKSVIIAEFKKILNKTHAIAAENDDNLRYRFDWSMEPNVPLGRELPIFTLQNQVTKLHGKDVSIFNKLSYHAQAARKSYHLEVALRHTSKMKKLVQYAKDAGIIKKYWGSHVHVSKVTYTSSSSLEAKRQCKVSQSHTNYQVSMVHEAVGGIIDIDDSADFHHPVSCQLIGSITLCQVILKYLKMSNGHSLVAKVHQAGSQLETTVIVPQTPEAEWMIATMNKNVAAFLWHMLLKQGNCLIVCLNVNKDIYKKSIGKALTDTNELSMKEIVGEFTGQKIGPTFFRGIKPINGVWAMADIKISNACVMSAGYRIRDHRMFIVDLVQSSMIGETPCQIQRLVSHRLNTKVPGDSTAKYIALLESSLARHQLIKRLGRAHKKSKLKKALCRRLDKIDQESKELMKNAEKTCRRIKSGRIPFSPKAALWI
jgi:hypothetical protein